MTTEKAWMKQYDSGVPEQLDYPEIPLHEFLVQEATKNPKRIALVSGEESLSYGRLLTQSRAFAKHLKLTGLQKGDRVGICLPNTLEFVITFFGTLMAGGIVAATNPSYPIKELRFQLDTAGMKYLVGYRDRMEDFKQIRNESGLETIVMVGNNDESFGEYVDPRIFDFNDFLLGANEGSKDTIVNGDDAAIFQFSGGTTGIPKAAVGLHRNLVANVVQFRTWLTNMTDEQETFMVAIPLYHVYGMVIGLSLGVAMGAKIVLVRDPKNIEDILNQIQKHRVTYFPGIPSIYQAINRQPSVVNGEVDLHSIKACISGSAPLLEQVRKDFEKLTKGRLVEGYGLSEAPTATHCNPIQGENRNGSIGLPLPDVDCKIVKLEDGVSEVRIGEAGELLIRGPQIMSGYFNQPNESETALNGGWLHTGDIARQDADGYFYIIGRLKELIKVGGLQVWPNEIEEALASHPKVGEIAAAGIPDRLRGETVKIWIVPKDDATPDLEEIQKFCIEHLASYKIPTEMEIREALPKTAVGKVLRRELIRQHLEGK